MVYCIFDDVFINCQADNKPNDFEAGQRKTENSSLLFEFLCKYLAQISWQQRSRGYYPLQDRHYSPPLFLPNKNAGREILGVKNVHIMHNEMDF